MAFKLQGSLGTISTGKNVQTSPAFSRDQAMSPVLADQLCISSVDLVYSDSGISFQREAALHFPPNPLIFSAGLTSFP